MKRQIIILAFLFMASNVFLACKDTEREADEVEIIEEDLETERTDDGAMDGGFGNYDENRDDQWDENEFSEAYQANFSGYDDDTTGDLNEEEFAAATFRSTDLNRDNSIDRQEWDEGYSTSFGDYAESEDFDRFDTDRSGGLSDTEWSTGFAESEWFSSYDADQDKTVNEGEWTRANFSRWDKNGDGFLSKEEFETYNRVMKRSQSTATGNPSEGNSP